MAWAQALGSRIWALGSPPKTARFLDVCLELKAQRPEPKITRLYNNLREVSESERVM
jgi:hypothetical protein